MNWLAFILMAGGPAAFGGPIQVNGLGPATGDPAAQLASEQKHFLECLAYVYQPELWISYRGNLYFAPKSDAQFRKIETMLVDRAAYVALTNRETRYHLAQASIARSGIGPEWEHKILLPLSETNYNLTPTLDKPVQIVPEYRVLKSLGAGDVLIQQSNSIYFIMEAGHGIEQKPGTNAYLIHEGTKTYRTAESQVNRVEAFTSVALNNEETAVLEKVVATFQRSAAAVKLPTRDAGAKPFVAESKSRPGQAQQEFQSLLARATDSNPYMQYLVARHYLEGVGTTRNEELGLEWMRRAAKNGSGDAARYLDKSKQAN